MANWCNTDYRVLGNRDDIEKLYGILERLEGKNEPGTFRHFGSLWLGNIIKELGGDPGKVYCRGQVTSFAYDREKELLLVEVESAWREQSEAREFIQSRLPGIQVYWISEEPGEFIYEKHDRLENPFWPENFIFEFCGGGIREERMFFETLDQAAEYISNFIGKELKPSKDEIDKALEEYALSREDADDTSWAFCEYAKV